MQSRRRRTTIGHQPRWSDRWRYFIWTSVCRASICADNVRGSSIRPATFPTIRYHAPYPDTNSDNHSLALSLRFCASRIMYSYSRVYSARTISLRSLVINTRAPQRSPRIPPRRWNVIFALARLSCQRASNSRLPARSHRTAIHHSRSLLAKPICNYSLRLRLWFHRLSSVHTLQCYLPAAIWLAFINTFTYPLY